MESLKNELEKLINDAAEASGYEIVEWVYMPGRKGILRVYINREGGVTLEDCKIFNEYLGSLLDIEDPISSSYVLEVSSPGVNRPLRNDKDFKMAKDKWVVIITNEAINGKKEFSGSLSEINDEYIVIVDGKNSHKINRQCIVKAQTDTPLFSKR